MKESDGYVERKRGRGEKKRERKKEKKKERERGRGVCVCMREKTVKRYLRSRRFCTSTFVSVLFLGKATTYTTA